MSFCLQRRPARLCFAQQSSYELGTLAYRIITGGAVRQGADLPSIPDVYPHKLHKLLPRLVAADPGMNTWTLFGVFLLCPARVRVSLLLSLPPLLLLLLVLVFLAVLRMVATPLDGARVVHPRLSTCSGLCCRHTIGAAGLCGLACHHQLIRAWGM